MSNSESVDFALIDEIAEEFALRYRRGERPSPQEYLERYPRIADELVPLLRSMVEIEQVKGDARESRPAPAAAPLRHFGDYHILREIGHGGMGVVFEAEQISLGRRVALKLLPETMLRDGRQKQRFDREARAAARLHHTNIVPVFAVGEHDGQPYYVMQLIQGLGLNEVLSEIHRLQPGHDPADRSDHSAIARDVSAHDVAQSLLTGEFRPQAPDVTAAISDLMITPPTSAENTGIYSFDERQFAANAPATLVLETPVSASMLMQGSSAVLSGPHRRGAKVGEGQSAYFHSVARIGTQIASALEYAHNQGILHRDVKPGNLLLDVHGTAWITDFGLAKLDDQRNLTQTGDILGTFRYMAPEAFDGKTDGRSDIYSLGLTLYEMLALQPAFDERDPNRLVKQVTSAQPAPLRRLNNAIPRDLATIIHKAIESDPARRYATPSEFAADLQRFLSDEPISARRVGAVEQFTRWCSRNLAVASLALGVLVLISMLAVVSTGGAIWLGKALHDAKTANTEGNAKLWDSLLSQARASRMTHRPGQRVDALRAIQKAQELPIPSGRSVNDLRAEAISALLLPDLEVAQEWDGWPVGSSAAALDRLFERYAVADQDGNVSIYRLSDQTKLQTMPGLGRLVSSGGLLFSPDGRYLHQLHEHARPGERPKSRLWRVDGPESVIVVEDAHLRCAFEPNGHRWAASYPDQTVRVFDLDSGQERSRIKHDFPVTLGIEWNPRSPQIALWSGDRCQIVDVDGGKIMREFRMPSELNWFAWHPDGARAAITTSKWLIHLVDTRTGESVQPPFEGHRSGGVECCFDHTGEWLIANDWTGNLRIWELRTGHPILTLPVGSAVLQFSPDGSLIGPVNVGNKAQIFRCHRSLGLRTVELTNGDGFTGVPVIDDQGRWAAVGARHGIAFVDIARSQVLAELPLASNLPFHQDSKTAALWTFGADGFLRWPLRNDASGQRLTGIGPPELIKNWPGNGTWSASHDGNVVALPDYRGRAVIWRRDRDQLHRVGPQDDLRYCGVSPDGRWIATGTHDIHDGAGARVWDAESGEHVVDLPVKGFCGVQFSPGGHWLLTSSTGCQLWEVGSWNEGPNLGGNNIASAFAADDTMLALGQQSEFVHLVVPETGRELARWAINENTRLKPIGFMSENTLLLAVGAESQLLYLFNLSAIREGLKPLGLDWDAPPLPKSPFASGDVDRVPIDLGYLQFGVQVRQKYADAMKQVQQKKWPEAIAVLRQVVAEAPGYAEANNNLAWVMLTCPPEFRDAAAALPFARKAVEMSPNGGIYLNTLGVALYRNREYKDAIEVLQRSLTASKGEWDAFDLFVLAMSYHRLAEETKSKACYDRAVKWLQDRRDKLNAEWLAELTQFQAEADAVMAEPIR